MDPEDRFFRLGSIFHHFLQVFNGLDRRVVNTLYDEALVYASIFQLAAADLLHLQAIDDIELFLL